MAIEPDMRNTIQSPLCVVHINESSLACLHSVPYSCPLSPWVLEGQGLNSALGLNVAFFNGSVYLLHQTPDLLATVSNKCFTFKIIITIIMNNFCSVLFQSFDSWTKKLCHSIACRTMVSVPVNNCSDWQPTGAPMDWGWTVMWERKYDSCHRGNSYLICVHGWGRVLQRVE